MILSPRLLSPAFPSQHQAIMIDAPSAAVQAALEEAARERTASIEPAPPAQAEPSAAVKAAMEEAARDRASPVAPAPEPSAAVRAMMEEAARDRVSQIPPAPSSSPSSSASSPAPPSTRVSRPPALGPPPGSAPKAAGEHAEIPDIPSVKAIRQPKIAKKPPLAAIQAPRPTGVEAMQLRLKTEQEKRQKGDESNMQLRLELNDSKKEVVRLKREVSKLERDIKAMERDHKRQERLKK